MGLRAISDLIFEVGKAQRMSAEYDRMNRMSTDALAEIGLQRGDIASHVFRKYNRSR